MGKKNFDNIGVDYNPETIGQAIETIIKPSEQKQPQNEPKTKQGKPLLVALRVNPEDWEKIKAIARIDNQSVNAIMNRLISKEIKSRENDLEILKKIEK